MRDRTAAAKCLPGKLTGILSGPADCARCPCGWEDTSYEGECNDCGCVACRDMSGRSLVCRLPDPVKRLIRRAADARREKLRAREYDGIAEWFAESERKDEIMRRALSETFPELAMTHGDPGMLRMRYEDYLRKYETEGDTGKP